MSAAKFGREDEVLIQEISSVQVYTVGYPGRIHDLLPKNEWNTFHKSIHSWDDVTFAYRPKANPPPLAIDPLKKHQYDWVACVRMRGATVLKDLSTQTAKQIQYNMNTMLGHSRTDWSIAEQLHADNRRYEHYSKMYVPVVAEKYFLRDQAKKQKAKVTTTVSLQFLNFLCVACLYRQIYVHSRAVLKNSHIHTFIHSYICFSTHTQNIGFYYIDKIEYTRTTCLKKAHLYNTHTHTLSNKQFVLSLFLFRPDI